MDRYGEAVLYGMIGDDVVIRVIDIHPAVFGVELDAAEYRMGEGFLYLRTGALGLIPNIHVGKAAEPAVLFTYAQHIPVDRAGREIHRHQPRIVERHDDRFADNDL